ncbi:MAG: hypothetical protein K0R24_1794 [Gammaproteobacteria bacterium]|nr:hypothetical protein [Gammaproteobacteria bacterium]
MPSLVAFAPHLLKSIRIMFLSCSGSFSGNSTFFFLAYSMPCLRTTAPSCFFTAHQMIFIICTRRMSLTSKAISFIIVFLIPASTTLGVSSTAATALFLFSAPTRFRTTPPCFFTSHWMVFIIVRHCCVNK